MRRHEKLDTIGLGAVFVLATVEAITHFGLRHDHHLCLGIPLMIVSALLLLAVHWPKPRARIEAARDDGNAPAASLSLSRTPGA